jgi:hypothetical protein
LPNLRVLAILHFLALVHHLLLAFLAFFHLAFLVHVKVNCRVEYLDFGPSFHMHLASLLAKSAC